LLEALAADPAPAAAAQWVPPPSGL
jgi:hypothetical protein